MSDQVRVLRPRQSLLSKAMDKQESQVEESAGDETKERTDPSEVDMADGGKDDSDSEPRLVIKEEPEDSVNEEKCDSERKYECKTCKPPNEFSNLADYLQHVKAQHQQYKPRSHGCPYCSYTYQNPKKLQRHILTAHKDVQGEKSGDIVRRNRCTMCSFVAYTPTDMENHQRLHHLKRRFFRCTKCSYMTHVRARYTKHVKYHSMPMIKCDDCDFRTPYKWNLDRHTRNHGGGGAFQCRACNFTAEIRQSLTVHETNHHEPPIGQVSNNKGASPFERKSKNSPKRYNQVGASDFRQADNSNKKSNSPTADGSASVNEEDREVDKDRMEEDGGDCIALKCEEKGCQFITAWDSEMQQHLAEAHASPLSPSKRKPLPMLIPLSPGSKPTSPSNIINVPRVRVRPELAKIARDTEIAKLSSRTETTSKGKDVSPPSNFEKRNASFFDKIKERLMTTSTGTGNDSQGTAVSNINDLKCWCTFKASSLDELSIHKKTHHTALSVSLGISRCPKCRRRCKTSSDLQMHIKICSAYNNNNNNNNDSNHNNDNSNSNSNNDRNSSQENTANSDSYVTTSSTNDFELPLQVDWDASYSGLNSSGSSVDGVANLNEPTTGTTTTTTTSRRVFKCPHCPFWASTASRFHVHIVGHLNRKPFECSVCSYRSNWRWDITKHIKLKGARDPGHLNARVLMTDETGRRNYSKYNKYLTQMGNQGAIDTAMEGTQGVMVDEPPKKVIIMTDSSTYSQVSLKRRQKPLTVDVSSSQVFKPWAPPYSRNHGQSLLKINPPAPKAADPVTQSSEEAKRTLWKCKRCNYRDSSKEVLLLHVKSHYENLDKTLRESNELGCNDCPFVANDAETLAMHKVHHRPNLEAIFKCYLCPYYVSTKAELLEHANLHGEELSVVHQSSSVDVSSNKTKSEIIKKKQTTNASEDMQSPLLLDTRSLPDSPMVWVARPDGSFAKMLKCRHCPHISSRKAEVKDHELMHTNGGATSTSGSLLSCPDCTFKCTQRDVMETHANMHLGLFGKVQCLVADNRLDEQQLDDIRRILGLTNIPEMGPEPDLRETKLVHSCNKCPARFLCEKELCIHLRYHSTTLNYSCDWCSYAAKQPAHLVAHQKAHSSEYQERTRHLSSLYGTSQRYPAPMTACIEVKNPTGNSNDKRNFAWIVVEVTSPSQNHQSQSEEQQRTNQVFTCTKCPARYFKLDALEYHMTLHGSNNRFKCEECDYSSKTAQNLMKHQVVHRRHAEMSEPLVARLQPQETTTCDAQKPVSGNPNFVYQPAVRNGRVREKKFKCHKCPSAFEKRDQYRIHLSLHGSKQKYRCDKCDYAVKYYANYVQHLKKHHANAEAQAARRQIEVVDQDEVLSIVEEQAALFDVTKSRRKSTISSSLSGMNCILSGPSGEPISPVSNQDKQTIMLMQKKAAALGFNELNEATLRCTDCPFSTNDQSILDTHKRRHGIERLTPPCPHCNYVPRKEENLGEHIRLHFTRLYKPEGYLIIDRVSLKIQKIKENENHNKNDKENQELLFSESEDGKFLPLTDVTLQPVTNKKGKSVHEKVIIDPNTGEATNRVKN